ncbi:MAG: TetR/AcrR family transcriptional regulator [Moorea sp. SIO3I7]|nr:TetR/AcrR family transcriptional regulator [Moorena sp. SIO3I7]
MTKLTSSRKPVRDRILEKASELFYQEGIQNVGIDRIISESGVAKMSLYNHFKSKDALIEAFLRQRGESWRAWFIETVAEHSSDPKERLLAIFDVLQLWFEAPDFRGCAFINATVELAKPNHPGYQAALEHQQAVYAYILDLAQAAGITDPELLARQFLLLVQGSIVVAMMEGNSIAAAQAKTVASGLLGRRE